MRKTVSAPRPAFNHFSTAAQSRIETVAARFRQAMAASDFPVARQCCEEVLRVMPQNMQVLSDYALTLMRVGEYKKSYKTYQKIYQASAAQRAQASDTWLDGLTEVCGWLEKHDEVARYGRESLEKSDAIFRQGHTVAYPAEAPPCFNPTNPTENIISFSLYGGQPRYCETLIKNIDVAR